MSFIFNCLTALVVWKLVISKFHIEGSIIDPNHLGCHYLWRPLHPLFSFFFLLYLFQSNPVYLLQILSKLQNGTGKFVSNFVNSENVGNFRILFQYSRRGLPFCLQLYFLSVCLNCSLRSFVWADVGIGHLLLVPGQWLPRLGHHLPCRQRCK